MSDIYSSVSYETASGKLIELAKQSERKKIELYVREGFGAPSIRTEERQYANGAVKTIASVLQPRDVTLQMVILAGSKLERDNLFYSLVSDLIQVGSKDDWGRLIVKRMDGKQVYLNCIYIGGMDEVVECYRKYHQFPLRFRAGDAYFYDLNETVLEPERLQSLIYLNDNLFLGNWTLTDGLTDVMIDNDGETFYPIFEVDGPAAVIRVTNAATGQMLAMDEDFALLTGEKLTIDCRENRRRIIFTNSDNEETDASHRLALGSSLVFPVIKGENSLQFYYTDISDESSFRIRYQRRYYSA